jgi:hypothetical protein
LHQPVGGLRKLGLVVEDEVLQRHRALRRPGVNFTKSLSPEKLLDNF